MVGLEATVLLKDRSSTDAAVSSPTQVFFSKTCVPHAAFVISRLLELDVIFTASSPEAVPRVTLAELHSPDKVVVVRGNATICYQLCSLKADDPQSLSLVHGVDPLGRDPLPGDRQIQQLVELILTEVNADLLEVTVQRLNALLMFRTFLFGHSFTVADLLLYEGLRRVNTWTGLLAQFGGSHFPHLARWYGMCDAHPLVVAACMELSTALKTNASTKRPLAHSVAPAAAVMAEQKAAATAAGKAPLVEGASSKKKTAVSEEDLAADQFNLSLPGAISGQVVTRFPPEASGFLHIGHVKAALINDYFARRYQGKLLLRFDDTNPAKEKEEFEVAIIKDLARLDIRPDSVSYTSDHFEMLLQVAERLIQEGKAYVDDTPVEQLREEKFSGVESASRTRSVEENARLFVEMQKEKRPGWVLRAKIDMSHKNRTLRDPVMYRFVDLPHARHGNKYHLYPTYDFACPIVDSVEGVTHALRSLEYHERNEQYEWFLKAAKVRPVFIWGFSRMNFMYTLLSKRKLTLFVQRGIVDGWDDPRFPTVQGLFRHGLTVEAIRTFVLSQGASKNANLMSWDKLWAENKKRIDPVAPRYTAIPAEHAVPLIIAGAPLELALKTLPRYKKNPEIGSKIVGFFHRVLLDQADARQIQDGEEVTLMDWGNLIIDKVLKTDGGVVRHLEGRLHLEGDFRKTSKKLTWLADTPDVVAATVSFFDHLITKEKLEEEDKLEDFIRTPSRRDIAVLCDPNVRTIKKGSRFQFERMGYFICDREFISPQKPAVFFEIPDGKSK